MAKKKKFKWTGRQAKALRQSICKWERMVDGESERHELCACCVNYYDNDCANCPIQKVSGRNQCDGTPYAEWRSYWWKTRRHSGDWEVKTGAEKKLARAELNFLRKVLAAGV